MINIFNKHKKEPNIVLFDIETAPILGYSWDIYETDVIEIVKDWYMLSFATKKLNDKKIKVYKLPDFRTYKKDKEDDSELVGKLCDFLKEADIIVSHNGDRFDLRKTNARLIVHGYPPLPPTKTIDTLKVARKYFKFSSNRLDHLGGILGVGRKEKHYGKNTWLGCMNGDKKSWDVLSRYNKRDVELLERVYLKLRPYIHRHPDRNIFIEEKEGCPKCGSHNTQRRGFMVAVTRKYQRYQCQECGGWWRRDVIKK